MTTGIEIFLAMMIAPVAGLVIAALVTLDHRRDMKRIRAERSSGDAVGRG